MEEKQTFTSRLAALLRQSWLLLLGAAVAVALLAYSGGSKTEQKSADGADASNTDSAEVLAEYARTLEKEIAALCSAVEGAGDAQVLLTLEGDFSSVYACNRKEVQSGERYELTEEYVTVGSGSSETALLLGQNTPTVSGIAIVCRGGDNADVRRELVSLLSAAFGIGANRIYITAGN